MPIMFLNEEHCTFCIIRKPYVQVGKLNPYVLTSYKNNITDNEQFRLNHYTKELKNINQSYSSVKKMKEIAECTKNRNVSPTIINY